MVFCKVVAVAPAQVRRDGQVRAKGSPVHHATLGPLEDKAGPGVIGTIAERAPLRARFVKGERERLLARAFMIRAIVLMTLMPDARPGDVIAALAGDLALVPWARPWRPASGRAAGDWRNALGPVPLEELRDYRAAIVLAGARRPGLPGCGDHREEQAAEGRDRWTGRWSGCRIRPRTGPSSAPSAPAMIPARTRACERCR